MKFLNGKIFSKYSPSELFTSYMLDLMKGKQNFMIFPNNKQILEGDEIDEYNAIHGINSPTERILFKALPTGGYVANSTECILSLYIPMALIVKDYKEFISLLNEQYVGSENIVTA